MDAITDKCRMVGPIMEVKSIRNLQQSNACLFYWTITQFGNLKIDVEYRKRTVYLNWMFTITKKRDKCVVTVITDIYKGGIRCSVRYCNSVSSDPILARIVGNGRYQVDFKNSIIDISENEFLKSNILELSFSFNESGSTLLTVQPKSPNDTFTSDYKKMHAKRVVTQIPDDRSFYFAFYNNKKKFYIHKAILAARSSYFRQYIRENCKEGETGEMKLNVSLEVMNCLISFLYTGQALFKCRKEYVVFLEHLKKWGIAAYKC